MFSANYIDQPIVTFMRLKESQTTFVIFKITALRFGILYLIVRNHDTICKYKVQVKRISNGELSDPLCYSVDKGLTLVRLSIQVQIPMQNLIDLPSRFEFPNIQVSTRTQDMTTS